MEVLASIAVLVVAGFIGYRVYKAKQRKPSGSGGLGGGAKENSNQQLK